MSSAPDPFIAMDGAIASAVCALSTTHVLALAAVFEKHREPTKRALAEVIDAVPQENVRLVARALADTWLNSAPDGSVIRDGAAIAMALRAAARATGQVRAQQSVEVVWTGPTVSVPVRLTPAVIAQLAGESTKVLWVVSFAAYKVPDVVDVLLAAANRGVEVRLVLETKDDSDGALSFDASVAFSKIRSRVSVLVWPHDQRPHTNGKVGAMHAKAVIADHCAAFVTSANLTGAALTENMELGLLVRGGDVPARLANHFQSLLDAGILAPP